jgi:hypothetical protein
MFLRAPALVHVDAARLEKVRRQSKVEAALSTASRRHDVHASFEVRLAVIWIDG